MQKITQVTEADVGRIAVSEDGHFQLKILEGDDNNSKLEFLKKAGCHSEGDRIKGFALMGGAREMFWEDSAKPTTPFQSWCAEKGYDPKGWFVYNMDLSNVAELSFTVDSKIRMSHDDKTFCPYFVDENGVSHFEYFDKEDDGIVLKQEQTQKVKVAKPRFHKKRQKPPVRQKTDVVIQYNTGEKYTLKNITKIEVHDEYIQIEIKKGITSDVQVKTVITVQRKGVCQIDIKSPGDLTNIRFSYIGIVVNTNDTYSVGSFWKRNFN